MELVWRIKWGNSYEKLKLYLMLSTYGLSSTDIFEMQKLKSCKD